MKIRDILESQQDISSELDRFIPFVKQELKLSALPKIAVVNSVPGAGGMTFGRYDPEKETIYLVSQGRHPRDVMRTLAHELVHYQQDQEQRLNADSGATGSSEENEANARAGVVMRNYNGADPMDVKEEINLDVFRRGFRREQTYGKYTLIATPGHFNLGQKFSDPSDQFRIEAYYGRSLVGWVNFERRDDNLEALDLVVDKNHRRKGIATAMYEFAHNLGNDIRPSNKQTPLGRAFWAGFDK